MRFFLNFFLCVALIGATGCVSKARLAREKREAFMAGQQDAMAKQISQLTQAQFKTVSVRGDVKNQTVPWVEGLTVAKAIVAAEYQGVSDPKRIIIIHNGEAQELKSSELLNGMDPVLQPGDAIELKLE